MIDDISDIAAYYDNAQDAEQSRLERHQLEHDLTWRHLDQHLPAQGAILEVGAATGRYTLGLAQRGYAVTAVDISANLLERCKHNLAAAGLAPRVQFLVADARDLSALPAAQFDAALLMGPLYHLVEQADRELALRAVVDRLRPGGVFVSAFISRYGILGDLMKNVPQWIEEQAEVRSILERGRDPEDYPRGHFRGYFAEVAEIIPLHEAIGLETITLAGVEPAISADDESYNRLEGAQRRLWLDLLYAISTEPSTIGASRHLLYIGRRPVA